MRRQGGQIVRARDVGYGTHLSGRDARPFALTGISTPCRRLRHGRQRLRRLPSPPREPRGAPCGVY